MNVINQLRMYLSYDFVIYAIVAGVLISFCSSLLGVTLVLRRYSFIGDSLSHVAFLAMTIASILKISQKIGLILPVTILCAVLLLVGEQKRKTSSDSVIAVISVVSLALGYLAMNLFSGSTNLAGDVCATLFGSTSILTLTVTDVYLCVGLSVVCAIVFIVMYHRIFAITFDSNFARAAGINTGRYELCLAVLIAVVIVLAMNLVGSLLISALIIIPAVTAMTLKNNFRAVTVTSVIISITGSVAGLLISIIYGTPVGSTIVAADVSIYLFCILFSGIKRKAVLAL